MPECGCKSRDDFADDADYKNVLSCSEDGKPESSAAYGPAIGHARVGISQGQDGYMTLEAVEALSLVRLSQKRRPPPHSPPPNRQSGTRTTHPMTDCVDVSSPVFPQTMAGKQMRARLPQKHAGECEPLYLNTHAQ
ncbi:hypothetical protein RRG08_047670 [Elysia crispata]|uniref:Uncharacterized protein n=1 Tax=Elysia crispata TaxID=231223 RepID=A0AAE1BEB8_9GAST|nr:hypothetical protein RRG08_047670 [Elysia crispata]